MTWVDDFLLAGPADEVCLRFDRPVTRAELRLTVERARVVLWEHGLRPEHSLAMQLPASLEHVTTMLAAWQIGAQLVTIDHRVPRAAFEDVLEMLGPRVVVRPNQTLSRAGWTKRSDHILVQVTSGSTGSPKAVGRRFADVIGEVTKTGRLPGMPARGQSMVVLAALAHTYGLFAGLLHGLHSGAQVVVPEHMTARGILNAVRETGQPTSIFGVSFHLKMLASVPHDVPNLVRVVSSGERLDPELAKRFAMPVGQIYGMTETGMIAGDLDGTCLPSVGRLAHGVVARACDGELLVRMDNTPYIGGQRRQATGWFATGDAATIGSDGLLNLQGRKDTQVTVGGLKVDLTAVERILMELPGVAEAVVVNDGVVTAYVVLRDGQVGDVDQELRRVLAPHQRPRIVHTVPALPRTPSGKVVRALDQLAALVLEEAAA